MLLTTVRPQEFVGYGGEYGATFYVYTSKHPAGPFTLRAPLSKVVAVCDATMCPAPAKHACADAAAASASACQRVALPHRRVGMCAGAAADAAAAAAAAAAR